MYIVHSDQWLRYAPCGCSPAVDEMRRLHAIVMCLRFCRGHIHSMCQGVFGFRPCSGLPKGPVDQEQCPPRRLTGRPGWRRGLGDSHISSVGAGLLAMASARFNSNTAPLASRASPLPQMRCASLADLAAKQTGLPPRTLLIRPSRLARNTSLVLDREQSIYREHSGGLKMLHRSGFAPVMPRPRPCRTCPRITPPRAERYRSDDLVETPEV